MGPPLRADAADAPGTPGRVSSRLRVEALEASQLAIVLALAIPPVDRPDRGETRPRGRVRRLRGPRLTRKGDSRGASVVVHLSRSRRAGATP